MHRNVSFSQPKFKLNKQIFCIVQTYVVNIKDAAVCVMKKRYSKVVLLHAMEVLGGRGGIAPTHP
jgi:hypothetical protein